MAQSGFEQKASTSQSNLSALSHEKREADAQLKKLRHTLTDSIDKEQKAAQRVEKQQSLVNFHRSRAASATQEINKLRVELKEQELAGWQNIQRRDERRSENNRMKNSNGFGSEAERSSGALGHSKSAPMLGQSASLRTPQRGSAVAAAAKLALPQSPLPQSPAAEGSRVVASSSSSKPSTGPGSRSAKVARSHTVQSSEAVDTLSEWFESKEKEMGADRQLSKGEPDWSALGFSIEDDYLFMDVESKDAEMKRKDEARAKGILEQQQRRAVISRREAEMDLQADKRRAVEERCRLNQCREDIRDAMIEKTGSAREAFSAIDSNGSGRVCMNEFDGGVRGLGVKWQDITGFDKIRKLFQLFDHDKKGYITYADLFPLDARDPQPERMSTPEFWEHWCKQNKDSGVKAMQQGRCAKWEPLGPEEKLDLIGKNKRQRENVNERKKWMRGMIHRLKHRGKSDARCREIVALHLPRGSGPRDLEDVQTFSDKEVGACKKAYTDKVQESVRNIEKTVYDMHDQRKKLHAFKQQLYQITEEPLLRQKAMDDARVSLQGLAGLVHKDKDKYHDE